MDFLVDGPPAAERTVLLAHGAGAPMDAPAMTAIARALADAGLRTARFEFGYMAARRSGARRPPPRAETLIPEYRTAVAALGAPRPVIGGKSMGGRVASLLVEELHAEGAVSGLLCIGYPFHPPGRPQQRRTAHLEALRAPALIVQGTRDPFGTRDDVAGYSLSPSIQLLWLEDGDHDLRPRKKVTGLTAADHLRTMAGAVAAWAARLA
jgi:uncharacterized protein